MTFKHDLEKKLPITVASLTWVRGHPGSGRHCPVATSFNFRAGEMMEGRGEEGQVRHSGRYGRNRVVNNSGNVSEWDAWHLK